MADETPPKKIGSLRDRIAAFEKSSATQQPSTAPTLPRSKPGGISWKPKQPSPPSSPNATESSHDAVAARAGGSGMSAADAKESIGQGVSLKERMAALQGKGAFGAPTPATPPPKPASDKPKWKPPPQPIRSPSVEKDLSDLGERVERQVDENVEHNEEEESIESKEVDPEEEERQRRAAIAARMQRLGASKIGMAPPVIGAKPAWKKPSLPKEEDSVQPKEEDEQLKGSTDSNSFDQSTTEEPVSKLSEEIPPGTSSAGSKSPLMPVPAVPRRTAPPRRKPGKTTVVESDEQTPLPDILADMEETKIVEKEEVSKEQVPFLGSAPAVVNEEGYGDDINSEAVVVKSAPVEEQFEEQHEDEQVVAHQGSLVEEKNVAVELETDFDHQKIDDAVYEESLSSAAIEEKEEEGLDATAVGEKEIEHLSGIEQPEDHDSVQLDSAAGHESQSFEDEETNDEAVVEDEEDEASRRARIAERLAQSGGINPLAAGASFASTPLPAPGLMRKSSVDVETPSRRGSLNVGSPLSRKSSVDVDVDESLPVRKVSSDAHEVSKEDIVEEADDKESERVHEEHLSTDFHNEARNEDEDENHNLSEASESQDAISKRSFEEDYENRRTSIISVPRERHEDTEYKISPPRRITVPPPPPIPVSSRSTPEEDEELPPPPLPSGRHIPTAIPPPPQLAPLRLSHPTAKQELKELDVPPPPPLPAKPTNWMSIPPPPPLHVDELEDTSHRPSLTPGKHVRRPSVPVPPSHTEEDLRYGTTSVPQPSPVKRPSVPPPHSTSRLTRELSSARRTSVPVPSPTSSSARSSYDEQRYDSSFVDPALFDISRRSNDAPPPLNIESEILDDADGDPIDPAFVSPMKSSRKGTHPPHLPPPPPPPPPPSLPLEDNDKETTPIPGYASPPHSVQATEEEEEERSRKARLAERMAKLGGIKFGASPPILRPAPSIHREEESVGRESQQTEEEQKERRDEGREESEADEQERRARIAAKLSGMGGMRLGMLPPGVPGRPPARPLPPPVEVETISEDDGVQVEAEESEMEEVRYEDVEESPPPILARQVRQTPQAPKRSLSSAGRPPVPGPTMARKPSVRESSMDSTGSYRPLPKANPSQSDYVMVEEPGVLDEEPAPPPPPRVSRAPPPPRSVPQPPPPPSDVPDSLLSSQWELPSIPSGSLDLGVGMGIGTGEVDLSSSTWSDDSTSYPSNPNRAHSSSLPASYHTSRQQQQPSGHAEAPLGTEQLNAAWDRVGIQMSEVAAELYDKSKKNVIGDGTYIGFINAVLTRVPNASPLQVDSGSSLGYLIYAQTSNAVHKRSADIMSGDIITLHDAKLKGHKGLQTYHQSVGEGEPLIGIVGEFDTKKSKVRVYQANQHVGQQTVEFVSYRLEDLKSGSVKIFRVLES